MDDDCCAICLDPIENDSFIIMPVCKHKFHSHCMISAAQYDIRCPTCRTQDTRIRSKDEFANRYFADVEDFFNERKIIHRRYQQKRRRAINKNEYLKKIQQQLREQKQQFDSVTKILEKKWSNLQKDVWKNDESLNVLRQERKQLNRKLNNLQRKLDTNIKRIIGEEEHEDIESTLLAIGNRIHESLNN